MDRDGTAMAMATTETGAKSGGLELSGAEIVIRALKDQGVTHIFGYPGGAVLGKAPRVAPAFPPGRSCDQRDLPVKPSRHKNLAFPGPGPLPRKCTAGYREAGARLADAATACNDKTAPRSGTHR